MTLPVQLNQLLDQVVGHDRPPTSDPSETPWDFARVPAKMAVYLLTDADPPMGSPLLLATVGDLRAALQRRLAARPKEVTPEHPAAPASTVAPSKRIRYGDICTRIYYRQVSSPFEANWYYQQAARLVFPESYRQMISWRAAQYLAINPTDKFPRFRRVEELSDPALTYVGPIRERRSADKLIETLEDLFDLCRYHQILVQAPHGKACSYKEMGKCPGPCDGSITLEQYRTQIAAALAVLIGADGTTPAGGDAGAISIWMQQQETLMKSAAARLDFEQAGKIKQRLARARLLAHESYALMRPWGQSSYLSLQPGPGKPWITPFFLRGGTITQEPAVKRKDLPAVVAHWFAACVEGGKLAAGESLPLGLVETEQLALVAHHLFKGEGGDDAGVYLPMDAVAAAPGGAAWLLHVAEEFLDRRKPPKPLLEQSSEAKVESHGGGEENVVGTEGTPAL